MKMASLLNLSSPFPIFFKNFYKTLVSNSLRRIISWLFVVYPLPSRLRPRVERCQPHLPAGFVSGLGEVERCRHTLVLSGSPPPQMGTIAAHLLGYRAARLHTPKPPADVPVR